MDGLIGGLLDSLTHRLIHLPGHAMPPISTFHINHFIH